MKKATKVIATIGPATESKEIIRELIENGMNVARFNTKHSTPDWHNERIHRVREVANEMGVSIGILLDLQGPEVRIDLPREEAFEVKVDENVIFSSNITTEGERTAYVPQLVINSLSPESLILLDDGACELIVTEVNQDHFVAKALNNCHVQHRKTMNTPGTILDMPSITDRDRSYLDEVDMKLVDFIGLSFVRDKEDIDILRDEMTQRQISADVVAKIENQAALDNIDEIVETADSVMIARGDLGVEVRYQELVYWQRVIIEKCRQAAKPVITATQMLKSMVTNPRPTRAEVSDVAHAIYDGTDSVMLSEETTIGKYPVKAVRTQSEIAIFNEQHTKLEMIWPANTSSSLDITSNAANLLIHTKQKIDVIVCLTETGRTAQLLSRFRPKQPIFAVTHDPLTYQKLSMVYGVEPYLFDFPEGKVEVDQDLIDRFVNSGMEISGMTILMIHGSEWQRPGLTNTLSLIKTS